ncbi:MAG TPA: MFS transporter [Terriglobales bacterium]|nr:MFS transporter [Terriglobales bacterium]
MAPTPAEQIENLRIRNAVNHPRSHVRWSLIAWLFVLSAVAFLDRVNISIAGGSLAKAYHLSNIQLGWVFSSFLAGYALFQTPGGRLADRLGPRRVLAGGVIWWGIFTALTASVPSQILGALWLFVTARFLLGAGEAVMYPASNQFVARWIPVQERGIANGWIFAGVGAGAGLSPPLITYVMLHYGWRASFWICAVIGLLAGLVWFIWAKDDPAEHPSVSASELEFIRHGISAGDTINKDQPLIAWSSILKSREVWAITLSYFSFGYVAWIFFSWFYLYLAQVRNLNLKASAFYAMLPFLAMAACCPLGGLISDRLTKKWGARVGRCYLAAAVILMAGIFLVMGSEVDSARLASVVLAGGAGALYLAQSSFWSVTADLAGRSSGSVSGFMNMGAQIGGMVTASLTPFIASRFGWTASFLVAAALCLFGALAWMIVDPERAIEGKPVAAKA